MSRFYVTRADVLGELNQLVCKRLGSRGLSFERIFAAPQLKRLLPAFHDRSERVSNRRGFDGTIHRNSNLVLLARVSAMGTNGTNDHNLVRVAVYDKVRIVRG